MTEQLDLAYDVEHLKSGKIIGYKWGNQPGGLVYDADGNVVGAIQDGVAEGSWYLRADQPHHTGKRYSGDAVLWSNRPSKKFNK
jgi:hypothetical protein